MAFGLGKDPDLVSGWDWFRNWCNRAGPGTCGFDRVEEQTHWCLLSVPFRFSFVSLGIYIYMFFVLNDGILMGYVWCGFWLLPDFAVAIGHCTRKRLLGLLILRRWARSTPLPPTPTNHRTVSRRGRAERSPGTHGCSRADTSGPTSL